MKHFDLEERSPTSSNRESTCQPLCFFERLKGKDEGGGEREVPGRHPILRDKGKMITCTRQPNSTHKPLEAEKRERRETKDALNALNGRQSVRLELG